jgi:hypothetical protein
MSSTSARRFARARDAVRALVEEHGCLMMKIATEDEALTHIEVEGRFDVFAPLLPMELKIGGPGARGDMEFARRIGIRHLIAPMIESAYGLEDYLNGATEIFGLNRGAVHLGVNFETDRACRDRGRILAADRDHQLAQITVGRGDLSKSMGCRPDDAPVMRAARRVVIEARRREYRLSIGGGIDPGNVGAVVKRLAPDFVNTRNFAFCAQTGLETAIRRALEAEILICRADGSRLARGRIASLEKRLEG